MIPILLLWLLVVIGVPLFALFAAAALGLLLDAPGGGWEAVAIDVFGAKLGESPTLMSVPLLVFAGCLVAEASTALGLHELARAWLARMPRAWVVAAWAACALGTTLALGHAVAGCAVLLLPALQRLREQPTAVPAATPSQALAGAHARHVLPQAAELLYVPLLFVTSIAVEMRPFQGATASALAAVVLAARTRGRAALRRDLLRVASEAVSVVGVVLAVAITAIGFETWLVHAEASAQLLDWLAGLGLPRIAFLLLANVLLLAGCWLLDRLPALLLLSPLLAPFADQHMVDVYELAVVFLLNAELAQLAGWPRVQAE